MTFWKRITGCLKKGGGGAEKNGNGKGAQTPPPKKELINMADIQQRVPPNQLPQFSVFKQRNAAYRARVNKYPDAMPKIDWEYYRKNVRPECVDWVNQFEKKYDKLDTMFVNRHVMISHRRYFEEVNKETEEMQREICSYKEASDKRIKALNEQMVTLKAMMPYEEMTMEEFCQHRPHLAPDFINKPTFWPHTPEEQTPGPSDPTAAHPEEPEEPPKAPPKPPAATPKDTASEAKKPTEIKKEEPSKAVEEMSAQVQQFLQFAVAKIAQLVQRVQAAAMAAKAAKAEKASTPLPKVLPKRTESSPSSAPAKPKSKEAAEEDDSYNRRESSPNICTQTIIRGEESEANPEVKAKHVDLSIEGDEGEDESPEKKCKKLQEMECKRKSKPEEDDDGDDDDPCKHQKKRETSECDDPCRDEEESLEKKCEELQKRETEKSDNECEKKDDKIEFKNSTSEDFAISISKCEPIQKDKKEPKHPCHPQEKASLNQMPDVGNSSQESGLRGMGIFSSESYPKETKELPNIGADKNLESAKGSEDKASVADGPPAGPQEVQDSPVTRYPRMEITPKPKKNEPEPTSVEAEKVAPTEDMAKRLFDIATDAASMLSEATISEEETEHLKKHRIETLEATYRSVHSQASRAVAEAFKAVESAKKLSKRSRNTTESQFRDHDAQAMAEKHALLAQLLAKRAVALKQEIAKVLEKLKNKE